MRGFALLFAILSVGLISAISFGLFQIIFGELKIGENARESSIAFFAADSGIERALFFNNQMHAYDTKGCQDPATGAKLDPLCEEVSSTATNITNRFFLGSNMFTNGVCVKVEIQRIDQNNDGAFDTTIISATGRNKGDAAQSCQSAAQVVVERGLKITIQE